MSYDDRYVFEAELGKVDYTDKVSEVRLAATERTPAGLAIWIRQDPTVDGAGGPVASKRRPIRLNVLVEDVDSAAAAWRVRQVLSLDDDAPLPF